MNSSPGSGTCVDVFFPAVVEAADQPGLSNGPPSQGSRPRLLVVDDDDMVRLAIERMLAHLGYRSLVAASGEEALVIYKQSGADIAAVILDITMPGLGGIETFRRLRQFDSRVKIIVSTSDPLNPTIRQIEAQGISYMIPKPFHAEQLARAIQQTLEEPSDFRRGAREENPNS